MNLFRHEQCGSRNNKPRFAALHEPILNKKLSKYQLHYHRAAQINVRPPTFSFELIARGPA
ncbi:hypothetical protein CIW54_09265 [Paraburkholderia sp. T12-10]|nr:hypothetical protein CIW54_09265 [Paraburkholderia sp. T12-10]